MKKLSEGNLNMKEFLKYSGKYASKEEQTGEIKGIMMENGLKAENFRGQEKKSLFKRVLSSYFKMAGMIHHI